MPPFALVPAYLSQFPTSRSVAVVIMAGLGPPLFRIQMTMLGILLMNGIPGADLFFSCFLLLFKAATYAYLRADNTEGEQVASAHPVNGAL